MKKIEKRNLRSQEYIQLLQNIANGFFQDPEFVKALMEFYDKYDHMVGTCFSGDIYFDRAFKEAMEEFLNVQMKPSISHFLADFLDSLLDKHGSKNVRYGQEEIDKFLDKSMDLFASLKDKDIFLGIYGANFSRRLIYNTVANDENEQAVIAKLKIWYEKLLTT